MEIRVMNEYLYGEERISRLKNRIMSLIDDYDSIIQYNIFSLELVETYLDLGILTENNIDVANSIRNTTVELFKNSILYTAMSSLNTNLGFYMTETQYGYYITPEELIDWLFAVNKSFKLRDIFYEFQEYSSLSPIDVIEKICCFVSFNEHIPIISRQYTYVLPYILCDR